MVSCMNLSNRISVPLEAYYQGKSIALVKLIDSGVWVAWDLPKAELDCLLQGKHVAVTKDRWILGGRQFSTPSQCIIAVFREEDLSKVSMSWTDRRIVEYHDLPYMQHLTHDELRQRWYDIMPLPLAKTQGGKIGLVPFEGPEMVKVADIFEECRCRYGRNPHPPGLTREQTVAVFPMPSSLSEQKRVDNLQGHLATLGSAKSIVRFGEPEYMRALHEHGEMILKPASEYDKSEMDGDLARQDNERRLETNVYKGTKKVFQCGDYWMYSVSECTGDPIILNRLFGDFNATACVVIDNVPAFFDRLNHLVRFIFPNTCRKWGPVSYVDPLLNELSEDDLPNLPMIKHFRFMYQHEFRYVAVPNNEVRERLEPKKLRLGSLRDIATYIGP